MNSLAILAIALLAPKLPILCINLYIKCCEHVKTRSIHDLAIKIASALKNEWFFFTLFLRSVRFIFVNHFRCSQKKFAERFRSSWYFFSHIFGTQMVHRTSYTLCELLLFKNSIEASSEFWKKKKTHKQKFIIVMIVFIQIRSKFICKYYAMSFDAYFAF